MYSSSFYSTILDQKILEGLEKELKNMTSVKWSDLAQSYTSPS